MGWRGSLIPLLPPQFQIPPPAPTVDNSASAAVQVTTRLIETQAACVDFKRRPLAETRKSTPLSLHDRQHGLGEARPAARPPARSLCDGFLT